MVRATDAKKDDLKRKKPGSVIPTEPKFIWVKMLNRVNGRSDFLALRSKFNDVLEEVLAQKDQHYIIDLVQVMADHSYFDMNNFINGEGAKRFWIEIDKTLENFDMKKTTLKPQIRYRRPPQKKPNRVPNKIWNYNNRVQNDTRYRMPPPPPRRNDMVKKRLDFD